MTVLKNKPRFSAEVQTRHGGVRIFENVMPASSRGMSYDPKKHNLMVVHEPSVGYRCIALEGVKEVWADKPKEQTRTERLFESARRGAKNLILK